MCVCVCVYRSNNHHFSASAYAYFWNIVRGKAKDEERTIEDFEKPIDPGRGANIMYSAFVSLEVVGIVQVRILVNATRFSFSQETGGVSLSARMEGSRRRSLQRQIFLPSSIYLVVFIFLFEKSTRNIDK